MRRNAFWTTAFVAVAAAIASPASAQIRLIGISGNQGSVPPPTNTGNVYNGVKQEAFFEINIANGSATQVGTGLWIPETQALGFNPSDGLIYRTGGADAYRSGADRVDDVGYRDDQYMETIDPSLLTPANASVIPAATAIFNADGPNLPDDPPILEFGLPAPRPTWLLPAEPRTSAQFDESFEQRGEDEYHALRGLAWSASQSLFFGSDQEGIFTMSPTGDSQFIGLPRAGYSQSKGIAFATVEGQERLLVTSRDTPGELPSDPNKRTAELLTIDPATGLQISSVALTQDPDPALNPDGIVFGVLALAEHPETGVLYGVSKGLSLGSVLDRELVTIDPTTGHVEFIGILGVNISSMAFVFPTEPACDVLGDTDCDNDIDLDDLNNVRNFFGTDSAEGDADHDGDTDLDDLNAVRNSFGANPGGANAVPEPSAAVLALCGMAALVFGIRRRR